MPKIVPNLWFDKEAKEAAAFYIRLLPGSRVPNVSTIHDTPSGSVDIVSAELGGAPFMMISAGPYFKINPSISFFLNFDPAREPDARERLKATWDSLAQGGQARMELGEYPFSPLYGWVQDRYGVNWQLILSNPEGEGRPFVVPSLMFTGLVAGRAEEAIDFYMGVFRDSRRGISARYPKGDGPDKEGTLMYADFTLEGQWFAAMDSAHPHGFAFNEAVSLMVRCDTQAEIDHYWGKLSAVPEAEQCGWLKDKFGLSWQIVPSAMDEMLSRGKPEQVRRVTQAFLKMKKFDLAALQAAYEGR